MQSKITNYFFIILALIFVKINAAAQSIDASYNTSYVQKNALNFELGGGSGLLGINYQRNFFVKNYSFHSLSAGVGFPIELYKPSQVFVPISYDFILGKKASKLQIGLTALNIFDSAPSPKTKTEREKWLSDPAYRKKPYEPPYQIWFLPKLGYNYYGKKNFLFKVFWSPVLSRDFSLEKYVFWYGWGGVSIGYSF